MTQDPNVEAQVAPTEVGANAAEAGDRDLMTEPHDAYSDHEVLAPGAVEGHVASRLDPDAPAVLEVEDLKMYFPVKSSGLVRRTIGHV
jgi:ABC-type microcin C transport system duplicated ATPase subunit YejF